MYGYGLKEYLNEKARVVDERELEIDARDSLRTSYQCEFTKKKISHDTKRCDKMKFLVTHFIN